MKFQTFKMVLLVAAFGLASCSSKTPKVELAAGSDPKVEMEKAETELAHLQANQYDRLSPNHFSKAQDAINDAKKKMEKGETNEKILSDIGVALSNIQEVEKNGDATTASLEPVLSARHAALDAQAPTVLPTRFKQADSEFAEVGRRIENRKFQVDAKEITTLSNTYSNIELDALKKTKLSQARSLIEKAENDKAKKYAPQTYEMAKAQVAEAEKAIELDRRNESVYSDKVTTATMSAQKLNQVIAIARNSKVSESVALKLYSQQNSIQNLRDRVATSQETVENQKESIGYLAKQNEKFASKEDLQKRIDEAKKTFSPEEADVMQDGSRVIVRLKSMKFASAKSDLKGDSMATLKKVSDLISAVPTSQVTVEGHTDSVGSAELNKTLSEKRAEAVKQYLVSQAVVSGDHIKAEGYGFEKPITSNKTATGRATNRRVDIIIDTAQATF